MRRDTRRVLGVDCEGNQIRINDKMKETEGESREGRVLHIHASHYAFLHNRGLLESGGVFVTRANGLASMFPRNISKYSATQNRGNKVQNPAAAFSTHASGSTPAGIWTPVNGYSSTSAPSPYVEGSTPAWNSYSRTPAPSPYVGGSTPAWNPYSKTPAPSPYVGGTTPAWNTYSRMSAPPTSAHAYAPASPPRSMLLNHSVLEDLASTIQWDMDLCDDPYGKSSS